MDVAHAGQAIYYQVLSLAPLGVAGLSSAVMLAWGAAAAIPVLLHFLNRRRQQPIQWAAMQLLMQVIEKEAKRMRIEQLLLLVLRVLILITLAIALARPFFYNDDNDALGNPLRPPKHWILAIDTSYSMGYRNGDQSRFDAAKARATNLLAEARQGDAYSLVALSKPARAVIGAPTFNQAAFLSELQRLRVQDTGSNLSSGLAIIEEIAGQSPLEAVAPLEAGATIERVAQLPAAAHIVFLSDFGRDSWAPAIEGPERLRLQQLQEKHLVEFEFFSDASPSNVAIKSMRPSTNRAIAGNSLPIEVVLESVGENPTRLPVQLEIDGKSVASEYVDLSDGKPKLVRFEAIPKSTGTSVLAVHVPDDRLSADNRREQIVEVRSQYRVLFVENQRGDSRLLRLALQPNRLANSAALAPSTQEIDTISKLDLVTADLSRWDVIVVNDVSTVGKQTVEKLERFARESGSVVFMFGPNALADSWNESLGDDDSLVGFRLDQPTPESDWALDPLEYRSPVVAPFAGFPDSGLLTSPLFRLWQIDQVQNPLTIDLATTDGKPLIVRRRIGNGWIASVLSAPQDGLSQATDPWNAIATWPSFLPLMQQLVQVVLDTGGTRTNLLAGEIIQGEVPPTADRKRITIVRPDGSESQIATESIMDRSGQQPWFYSQTENRGIYRAQLGGGDMQLFAVNINPLESKLDSITLEQLPQQLAGNQSLSSLVRAELSDERANLLARMLLGLLFILLVSESLLAWSMGRRIG